MLGKNIYIIIDGVVFIKYELFYEYLGDNSFSMDMQQIWRFLKEIKILGESVTLASINRSFSKGIKNNFRILTSENEIKEEIERMKSIGRFLTEEERKDLKLVQYLQSLNKNQKMKISIFSQGEVSGDS